MAMYKTRQEQDKASARGNPPAQQQSDVPWSTRIEFTTDHAAPPPPPSLPPSLLPSLPPSLPPSLQCSAFPTTPRGVGPAHDSVAAETQHWRTNLIARMTQGGQPPPAPYMLQRRPCRVVVIAIYPNSSAARLRRERWAVGSGHPIIVEPPILAIHSSIHPSTVSRPWQEGGVG